ncbi:MAG: RHS repeat-associated core domain-containing protein [Sandaracinaceae bacterium]|nr:RHS repeat-associated core domain-containing protein [Sandaracinaceae bacterium]
MVETTATWDRGFGVLRTATDPNGQTTTVAYDGLARLTAVTPPNFNDCPMIDVPVQTFRYDLVVDGRPVSRITALQNHGNVGCTAPAYIESVSYVDGLGRARAALTRRSGTEWERSGVTIFNARGTAYLGYQNDLVSGAMPTLDTVLARPSAYFTEAEYDAFGRVTKAWAEDRSRTETRYGATSTVVCDALDLSNDPRFKDTCTLTRVDGHGRSYDQVLHQRRASQGYADEYYRLYTLYRPDNAVALVLRAETADAAPVETTSLVGNRSSSVCSTWTPLGRRVGERGPRQRLCATWSMDETNRTWRYLFNDVGDPIAVRDPRGCGQNFFYDHAGRLIAEDYVECDEVLPAGTRPVYPLPASAIAEGEIGSGTAQYVDARYYFDEEPEFTGGFVTAFFPTPHLVGRATGSVDRAQASVAVYDARGQAEVSVRIMSLITEARALDPTLPEDLDDDGVHTAAAPSDQVFDNANAYFTMTAYDNLGRPTQMTYPDVIDGTSVSQTLVRGRLSYNQLGLPTAVNLDVFYQSTSATPAYSTPIVRDITYDANRLPIRIDYGDQGVTHDLHAEMRYDERLRVLRSWATRNAPATTGLNAVTRVHDFNYVWDAVSNLRVVTDARLNNEWSAGYRPWQQTIDHDALYRVNEIDIHYMDASGQWNPSYLDAATDWRSERTRPNQDGSTHEQRDPMRRRPAPMVSNNAPDRVRNLVYDYDWLANMTDWTDDAGVFYERSAGLLTSGNDAPDFNGWGPTHRPSALYLSTNISDAPGGPSSVPRGGYVWLDYGESGSVVGMTVHGECHDRSETTLCQDLDPATSSFGDRKAALEAGCVCAEEQHYRYDWDELNRLAEARRYDRTGGSGPWDLAVQQRYRYDAANVRMIKETIDHSAAPFAAVTLTPYPGSFERRGLTLNTLDSTYDSSASLNSESQYNIGGARLVWGTDDPRTGELTRSQRLTLPLSDLVQSTAAVVDLQSGDLIEHTTFYPNGARETHLSTDEVSMQLEPVGFTGKEADEEVGLVYFGERYLIPRLGRWASVDPLSVHAMGGGEAMNGYHYVSGNLLQARDPLGLQTDDEAIEVDSGGDYASDFCGATAGCRMGTGGELIITGQAPPTAPATIGPPRPSGPPTAEQVRYTRLWRDQQFRESGVSHSGSFIDFVAGIARFLDASVCNFGLNSHLERCGGQDDLFGRLEDEGLDLGVDRRSIQYGYFSSGPSLQDALGMALGGFLSRFSSHGAVPAAAEQTATRTNAELIQEVATRAERRIGGIGRHAGSLKHRYAQRVLDRYQRMFGDRGLRTEISFLGRVQVRYGTRGSARIDVLDELANIAYDFKFTIRPPGMSARQISHIQSQGPLGVRVVEVNP